MFIVNKNKTKIEELHSIDCIYATPEMTSMIIYVNGKEFDYCSIKDSKKLINSIISKLNNENLIQLV
jgi:hypothetical protein